jgi:hypothetical protein
LVSPRGQLFLPSSLISTFPTAPTTLPPPPPPTLMTSPPSPPPHPSPSQK